MGEVLQREVLGQKDDMKLPVMLQINNQIVDADKRVVCEVGNNPKAAEEGKWLVDLINSKVEVKEEKSVIKEEVKKKKKK